MELRRYHRKAKSQSDIDYKELKKIKKDIDKTFWFYPSSKIFHYNEEDEEIKNETIQHIVLLDAINEIGKSGNLHFSDFNQAIINFAKFAIHLLKDDFEFKVYVRKILSNKDDVEVIVSSVLSYLEEKINKFKFLKRKLNFSSGDFVESSTILLYTNFLNFFFLKKSKKELFERCATILYVKRKNFDEILQNEEKNILTNILTYKYLIYFVSQGKTDFSPKTIKSLPENFFKSTDIPLIVTKKFLENCKKNDILPLEIYFQLQFIFNALDNKKARPLFIESCFTAIKKLKETKVPPLEVMASNIRAINNSKILQEKKHKSYEWKKFFSKNKEEEEEEADDVFFDKKAAPPKVKNYLERKDEERYDYFSDENEIEIEDETDFWNPKEYDYKLKNGILINKKAKKSNVEKWDQLISNIQIKVTNNDSLPRFDSIPKRSYVEKIYKFYYYDEEENNWIFNENEFNSFIKTNNMKNTKTPIVLFINSKEKDIIDINSYFINGSFPVLDEDKIFVYSLCCKTLSLLNFHIDFTSKEKGSIKPILLLLHVPKKKEKIPYIKLIIYQIYVFLSFICDIEIMVLNKSYYSDQIDFIQNINNIKQSFQILTKEEAKFYFDKKIIEEEEDDDDDTEFYKYAKMWCNRKYKNQDIKKAIDANLKNLNGQKHIFEKKSKIIFLLNDKKIKNELENINSNNTIISSINQKFEKSLLKVHYINVKDPKTYKDFLLSFNNFSLDKAKEYDNNLISIFKAIKLTDFSSTYINLKNSKDIRKELFEITLQRFLSFKNDEEDDGGGDYNIITTIRKEMLKIYPVFDKSFANECNCVLSDIQTNKSKRNSELIKKELKISSDNNLDSLKYVINSEMIWTKEQLDNIQNSHFQFLKEEFFSIIKDKYSDTFEKIYEANISILDDQINDDLEKFQKIFNDFEKKTKIKKQKQIKIDQEIMKGTNYSIREEENEKEVKVRVEIGGKLEDLIPQDF